MLHLHEGPIFGLTTKRWKVGKISLTPNGMNPWPLDHKACALPLCYDHCQALRIHTSWHSFIIQAPERQICGHSSDVLNTTIADKEMTWFWLWLFSSKSSLGLFRLNRKSVAIKRYPQPFVFSEMRMIRLVMSSFASKEVWSCKIIA